MQKVDIAELRRLHAQGARSSHSFYVFDSIPALLDELEAARLEMRRQASVIAEYKEQVLRLREVVTAPTYREALALLAGKDARDGRMKAIGAAEELERSAKTLREDLADMNPPEFASRGKVAPGYCECLQDVADGMEERAAQLRLEAGE